MRPELAEILSRNRPQLVENIDPEHGILNDLLAMNVLTRRQAKTIEVLPDPFRQVEALLDMLRRRPDEDFDKFCEILCKHGQEDVVTSYLKPKSSDGDKKPPSQEIQHNETSVKTENRQEPQFLSSPTDIRIQKTTMEFYNQYKDQAYPMFKQYRGRCVIFNVKNVRGMAQRQGSEEDLRKLKELFTLLHFSTDMSTDPTAKAIVDKIKGISQNPDLKNDQCLVLFFLSHGRIVTSLNRHGHTAVEHIYGSDGEPVTSEQILEPLTNAHCEAMRGKPKVVFFQACREYSYSGLQETSHTDAIIGVEESQISSSSAEVPTSSSPEQLPISLKDFVIAYATESGYPAFRDSNSGSWYISAIVKVFSESVHCMDLCAMLRKVNGIITEQKPIGASVDNRLRQVASHIDSLTKPYLYFFPGITNGSS